jgi:hypothetical protein
MGLLSTVDEIFYHTHAVPLRSRYGWRVQTEANIADFSRHRHIFNGWIFVDGASALQEMFDANDKMEIPRPGSHRPRVFKKLYDPKHWITTFLKLLCDSVRGVDITFMNVEINLPGILMGDYEILIDYLNCSFGNPVDIKNFLSLPVRNKVLETFETDERRKEFAIFLETFEVFANIIIEAQQTPANSIKIVKDLWAFVSKIRSPIATTQETLTKIVKGLESLSVFIKQTKPTSTSLMSTYAVERYFLTTKSPSAITIIAKVLSGTGRAPIEISPGFRIVRNYVVTENRY